MNTFAIQVHSKMLIAWKLILIEEFVIIAFDNDARRRTAYLRINKDVYT